MKKLIATVSAVALGLGLAACDSAKEDAAESQADAMVDSAEAQADALEDQGAITDDQADAMVDKAKAEGDAVEADAEAAAHEGTAAPATTVAR